MTSAEEGVVAAVVAAITARYADVTADPGPGAAVTLTWPDNTHLILASLRTRERVHEQHTADVTRVWIRAADADGGRVEVEPDPVMDAALTDTGQVVFVDVAAGRVGLPHVGKRLPRPGERFTVWWTTLETAPWTNAGVYPDAWERLVTARRLQAAATHPVRDNRGRRNRVITGHVTRARTAGAPEARHPVIAAAVESVDDTLHAAGVEVVDWLMRETADAPAPVSQLLARLREQTPQLEGVDESILRMYLEQTGKMLARLGIPVLTFLDVADDHRSHHERVCDRCGLPLQDWVRGSVHPPDVCPTPPTDETGKATSADGKTRP